jgi:YD repeat-containing protein
MSVVCRRSLNSFAGRALFQGRRGCGVRWARWLAVIWACSAIAADKSGVSPNTISLPSGPGSIEGLGESFQPTLNTGTAKHGIALLVPRGTAGHQPSLSLAYDGGGANGPIGYGWALPLPHVQHRTDKGIPTYGEDVGVARPEVFINEQREELVPTPDGYFRCANEASFVRYRRVEDHWEGTMPNGTRLEFGVTADARIEDAATGRVFAWLLERETDTRGNTIEYGYRAFGGEANLNQKYLATIRYGPGAGPWPNYHFVVFEYEDRPDGFEDARAGFLVRTGKRLKTIHVGTQGVELDGHLMGDFDGDGQPDTLNRRYDLEYLRYAGDASHWSLLSRVTLVGADGVTSLPPARFDYAVSNPAAELSAQGHIWGGIDEPFAVMDNDLVDLVDLNGDGLPDVLKTEAGGGVHTGWINRGPVRQGDEWALAWSAPEAVDAGLGAAWNFDLASDRTHLADMDGDGLSDLVHRSGDDAVFYFANLGSLAWSERRQMAVEEVAPPAPFGNVNVRTADLDFDKRMDILQSVDIGGGVGYRVWFNLGSQAFSPSVLVEPEGGFDLALPGVQIADCNGDRVPDVARIQSGAVQVAAGLGYGRFAPVRSMVLPDITLDDLQIAQARLTDINGDGLADLVLERGAPGECWYWLNLGNYTWTERKRIVDLPAVSAGTAVRWADLNGNGTTDLVYADAQSTPRIQLVELGELVSGGLAPNLLRRIDNGIGRVTEIEYAPSTRFALEDMAAGAPWPDALPFPVTVVAGVRVSDSLGHEYETRFRYHDGYYDPVEKQFRGFGRVEQIDVGDPTAPTLVSRSEFDTGRTFDAMKGRLLRLSAETEEGGLFSTESTLWADPPRLLLVGTNGEAVRFAHPVRTVREIVELGQGTPRRLESEFEYDDYGNQTRVADYGVVEEDDRTAWNDERITVTEYALHLESWILRLPTRQRIEDETGVAIARSELFYDDETFSGNNPGEVTIGNLTLQRDWTDPLEPAAYVSSTRTRYDRYGNAVELFDPLWVDSDGTDQGHYRSLDYDSGFRSYPVRETIHVGRGKPPLVFEAEYDEGLATVRRSTDFNGNTTTYAFDALGRLVRMVKPGDSTEYPTLEYAYGVAVPTAAGGLVNYVETRQLDRDPGTAGEKPDHYLIARQFMDGLGRVLMTRSEAEPAEGSAAPRVVVSGAVLFNARQQAARSLNPHFTTVDGSLEEMLDFEHIEASGWRGWFHEQGALVELDLASAHAVASEFDATLRVVRAVNPDGTFGRTEFQPLVTRVFDENDTDEGSPHYDTPMVQFTDGLGRLIRVDEVVRLNDDGTPATALQTWTTRYDYNLNDRLVRTVDSQQNVKELQYDGLKRKISMNDPDAGISTYVYDDASNLIETVDAKGQRITYTYDGVNRILTEEYHDELSTEHSYQRSPDVLYHYDAPAERLDQGDGTRSTARNVRGMLAWVEDTSGEEHTSFDTRGRIEWTVKRIPDPVLSAALNPEPSTLVAYRTVFEFDSMDRIRQMIYPDQDQVTYAYNARGLLERILGGPTGHILPAIRYLPSGQQEGIDYGNGVRTSYTYDERMRLSRLFTRQATSNVELIHFGYELDGVSNIKAIQDERPVSAVPLEDSRRNAQAFQYDNLYRLTRVDYNAPNPPTANGGGIQYRYDRIGNMLAQTSDIAQFEKGFSVTDLGTMDYGGPSGRSGRRGRSAGEPPGPHALSQIKNQKSEIRNYRYDANGNMTDLDGLRCAWDFRDRLVVVEDDTMRTEYRYDYTGRRVMKRVFAKGNPPGEPELAPSADPELRSASTLYPGCNLEVREADQPTKYVFNAGTRVAAITGSFSTNERIQRLRLFPGWNLVSLAVSVSDPLAQFIRISNEEGGQTEGAIQSIYRWRSASEDYSALEAGQAVPAGAILWVKARDL